MRCLSCNICLNDFESRRKSLDTADFIDLCDSCFSTIASDIFTSDNLEDSSSGDVFSEKSTEDSHKESADLFGSGDV